MSDKLNRALNKTKIKLQAILSNPKQRLVFFVVIFAALAPSQAFVPGAAQSPVADFMGLLDFNFNKKPAWYEYNTLVNAAQ